MRNISLALGVAIIAALAWLSAYCDEPQKAGKPQTTGEGEPKAAVENEPPGDDAGRNDPHEEPVKAIISGKVMPLGEALGRRGIKSYAEEIKGEIVLVTRAGELVPIVPDWRGRAFYQDERLRNRPVDLVVNRRAGVPWVQVLSIYTFDDKGTRNITDYWCDICAIPMYEIKDCECCQGPTRLRFRPQELPTDVSRPASDSSKHDADRAGDLERKPKSE
jgi:hypothetical protein